MDAYNKMEYNIENVQGEVSKSKRKIKLEQLFIPIISILLLSFLFSYFMLSKSIGNLEGVWVRQPDDSPMANGMVIEVKKENGIYVGEVIAIDDEYGMPIGTLKWRGFQKDALNVFAYYDMTLSNVESERSYGVSYALISLDGKTLTIYSSGAVYGSHQVWIKQ